MVGSDVTALVAAPGRAALDDLLAGSVGQTRRAEVSLTRSDGSTVPVLTSAAGLDIDGLLCLVASDLSNRRRGEEKLADANAAVAAHSAHLERANAELTRSNDDLAQFLRGRP